MEEELKIGDFVTYVDPVGVSHNAIVIQVWGPNCINLVYVSDDESKSDSWGRQTERDSSVQRKSDTTAHGRYFTS